MKWVCKICGFIIRRPGDHRLDCPGVFDRSSLVPRKPKVSPTEITRDIVIPEYLKSHKSRYGVIEI